MGVALSKHMPPHEPLPRNGNGASPSLTRRGRTLRHALASAVLVALGGAASSWLLYIVLGNARSLQYLQSWAEEAGLSLSIESGSTWVPGSWSLGDVRLASEGAWSISAERVRLDLDLLDWLGGHRHVTELVLDGATLEVSPLRAHSEQAASTGDTGAQRTLPIGLEASLGQGGRGARRIVIEHIAANGDRIRVGGYELSGKLEYRARGAAVFGPAEARLAGGLDFGDAQLRYAGTLVGTMSGRASVDLATTKDAPQSLRTALRRASWKVEAAGHLKDIGALPVSARMRPTLEGASYRGSFSAIGDRVERAHLLLEARRATLAPAPISRSELSGKVELLVDYERQRPEAGRAKLKAERWKLSDESERRWLEVAGFEATLGWRATPRGPSRATLEATGKLAADAWNATLTGSFAGSFDVTGAISRGELSSGTGEVHVRDADLVPHTTPTTAYGLSATFRIERAKLDPVHGFHYAGTAALNGEDAGMLLDLAGASDRVRWTLSMLDGDPFSLVSRVTRRAEALALEDLKLTSAGFEARGAAYVWNDRKMGAFVIDGPARVGILFDQKSAEDVPGLEPVLPVAPHWLDRRLEDLAERWQAQSAIR